MILDVGSLYAIYAFVCAIIAVVILNRTLSTKYKQTIDKPFCILLLFFILFCTVDCIWGICTSKWSVSRLVYTVWTNGFHCMSALSAFMWARYMLRYIDLSGIMRKIISVVCFVLLAFQFGLLISNFFTNAVFYIDENSVYVPLEPRRILFWCQFAHYVILALCNISLLNFKNRSKEQKRIYQTALIFSSVPMVSGLLQMVFPDAPMYSIGFMISAVTIYSFNITSQREKDLEKKFDDENNKLVSIISGISDDYQAIYFVDMKTNEYEIFESSDDFSKNVLNELVRATDFFVDLKQNIETMGNEDDRILMAAQLDKEHIISELKTRKSFSFNYRLNVNGNARYYLTKVTRSGLGEDKIIIGIFDDDERVRKEIEKQEELRSAWEQADQASKAKSKFLFNMSHDIRTPMNAILGYTGMAIKCISEPDKACEYLEKVTLSGNHLLSIINDILDMSRIENNKLTVEEVPLSIINITHDIIEIVSPMAKERSIELIRDGGIPEHEWIYTDDNCIKRILLNIFTNAVKYNRQGGQIYYSINECPGQDENSELLKFTVRDTGIGMSEEFLEHVFETFSREKSSTLSGVEGTGLGMPITKSIVELLGGSISIESKKDVGTTVTIVLPLRFAEAPEKNVIDKTVISQEKDVLKGKRVLLVEDNELNAEIAVDVLGDFGLVVDTANDGTVAVEKCRKLLGSFEARYDFILMDIQMPIMNGYEATGMIRALRDPYFKKVPIIAMTANVFEDDIKKSLDVGMNAHLGKPVNVDELRTVLTKFSN